MTDVADPTSLETLRAAVEAMIPGDGDVPSGADTGAHLHVAGQADRYLEGFADVIAALLDAFAAEIAGRPFAALEPEDRLRAIRGLASDEAVDMRDAADALFAFAFGAVYSEWSGYDRDRRVLGPPASWASMGFPGPSIGYPDFVVPPPGPAPDIRHVEP